MLFNSYDFLIFFPLATAVFFALPHRFRWAWLLAASCYFYMAFIPVYILILGVTIVIDYAAGIWIERSSGRTRRLWLVLSLVATFAVLAVFKYYSFLAQNLDAVYAALGLSWRTPPMSIALPIGLSFHTFQSMSYVIEVYRGRQAAERRFGIYALYVMFYPQLVAGPIERPQRLLHQFDEPHRFDWDRMSEGLRLMLWGFFKKLVVADRAAAVVDTVYADPSGYHGIPLLIAVTLFSFQIYCDFSGYSDIAVGAARVMGFRLMRNFNRPYASASVAEFWRRWHISLSTWFKDYLYVPLGGNRAGFFRWQLNLAIVFLVSGLWHGANWTFVAWGGLHGFYLLTSIRTERLRGGVSAALGKVLPAAMLRSGRVLTTFALVTFAWIFFRAGDLPQAVGVAGRLFSGIGAELSQIAAGGFWSGRYLLGQDLGVTKVDLALTLLAIVVMEMGERVRSHPGATAVFAGPRRTWLRWAACYLLIASIALLAVDQSNQFIYFQF